MEEQNYSIISIFKDRFCKSLRNRNFQFSLNLSESPKFYIIVLNLFSLKTASLLHYASISFHCYPNLLIKSSHFYLIYFDFFFMLYYCNFCFKILYIIPLITFNLYYLFNMRSVLLPDIRSYRNLSHGFICELSVRREKIADMWPG